MSYESVFTSALMAPKMAKLGFFRFFDGYVRDLEQAYLKAVSGKPPVDSHDEYPIPASIRGRYEEYLH